MTCFQKNVIYQNCGHNISQMFDAILISYLILLSSKFQPVVRKKLLHTYMLFTGWEVHIGRNCARGLEYRRGRYSDRGYLKVSGKFYFSLQPMGVEVGRVLVDEECDRLQTKPKYYNMIFSSLIYIITIKVARLDFLGETPPTFEH